MSCNQTWNTDLCRPYQFEPNLSNVTAEPDNPDNEYHEYWSEGPLYVSPAEQYENSFESFSGSTVGTLFLTWFILVATLTLGPKSLVRSFVVAFPAAMLMDLILLIKATTLPNAGWGMRSLFQPSFKTFFTRAYSWEMVQSMVTGKSIFLASYGSLVFVGKHVDENKLALPYVAFGGLAFFIVTTLNIVKVGGFFGAHRDLTQFDPTNDWTWWNCDFGHVPVLLSRQPGSNFWLLLHFGFHLCTSFPSCALILETIASSVAEIFPANKSEWLQRTKFPWNLPLTVSLGLLGFVSSTIGVYFSKESQDFHEGLGVTFYLVFPMVLYFMVAAIVPLTLSKVAAHSSGREDLISFIQRQSSTTMCCGIVIPTILFKIMIVVGVFVGWIVAWISGVPIVIVFIDRLAHGRIWCIVFFCVLILFILGGFVVKTALHACNREGHPCCVPIGPVLKKKEDNDDHEAETLDEKMILTPFHG